MLSFFTRFFFDRLQHAARFSLVGLIATGINYAALYVFFGKLSLAIIVAATIAFILSTGANFFLQRFWTFQDSCHGSLSRQLFLFVLAGLCMLALNDALMWSFSDVIRLNYLLAQTAATLLVSVFSIIATRRIFAPSTQSIRD